MKKKFLVLTTALIMAFSATFAHNATPVPAAIENELHQQFAGASDVQWQATDNFYKATFTIDGHSLKAFYSFDGSMIGLSRNITVYQLPMALIKEVNEKAANNTITDLFELLTDRGTEYYITYQNGKDTKTYSSIGVDWVRY